jgi:hypothetical protein
VAEGGALLRRYGGTNLHRGFESLLLRFTTSEGWQSGRMRRSRKPFRASGSDEGSNPSPSAQPECLQSRSHQADDASNDSASETYRVAPTDR